MDQRTKGVFICIYLGYMVITYIRKSVSFVSSALMTTEAMGKGQIGLILSSQTFGYSIGKLLGGVLVDIYSPSLVFVITLVLAAVTVVTLTVLDSVALFAFFWFINGLSQGPCWPACALLIKRWFPSERFGTWWSVLSTSMNVSGTAGPILSALLLNFYGWRFAMIIAGACAIAMAGMAMLMLADNPSNRESSERNEMGKRRMSRSEWKSDVWRDLLTQPVFIVTALGYLLVSVVRGACTDWGHLYLTQEKQHSHLTGSSFTSSQELGGIIGSLAAGYASDFLISKRINFYHPRMLVIFFCTIVQSVSIFLFIFTISHKSSNLMISLIGFHTGFGVYGSIALFGVVAMEITGDRLAGTAHSIVALAANVGLVLSGFPLSLVARQHSWYGAFLVVQGVAVLTTIIAFFSIHCSASTTLPVKAHQR